MVMNADGSNPVAIVATAGHPSLTEVAVPDWSPDGSRIAFRCGQRTTLWADICTVNASGTNLTRLTTDPYWDNEPRWSPDGSKILFSTNRGTLDGVMHVAVMNAAGGDFVQLTPGISPVWSRDGSRIVFSLADPVPGLYLMKSDGSDVVKLTATVGYGLAWRP